jgi:outer membrane cobalamin receptor
MLSLAGTSSTSRAQSGKPLTGHVVDTQNAPIAGARILAKDGSVLAVSDLSGQFSLPAGTPAIQVTAPGFLPVTVTIGASAPLITLKPVAESQTVSVTAYLSPVSLLDSPASTRTLTTTELNESASPVLDNKIRQIPGAELFRRSSSLVANPTSQGISLRGLGSTAASRTMVLSDDIPILDPYGAWIHWEEMPELSIKSVDVVRGGVSDLYGSSAIGGVINVTPVRATGNAFDLLSSYGSENTTDNAVLGTLKGGKWNALAAGGLLRTDGYILTAPFERGTVDIPSNVHAQNGAVEIDRDFLSTGRIFLRGNGFNEARSNGTPLQTNATRLWRYSTGVDWTASSGGSLVFRVFGDNEHYRQSFSNVAANRDSETLTRTGLTPAQELGAAARWSQPLGATLLVVGGADTHDVRATDYETSYKSNKPSGILDTSARQRQTGVYGEALWTPAKWTLSAGGRIDHFSNFDATQWTSPPLAEANLPAYLANRLRSPAGQSRAGSYQQLFAHRVGLPRLPRTHAERALSHRPGRPGAHQGKSQPPLGTSDRLGDRHCPRVTRYNTYAARQLLLDASQRSDHRAHRQHDADT